VHSGLVKGVAKAPEIAEEDMNVMFTTNVTGLINMTQAILPIFLRRPNGGSGDIINIGSVAGREPYSGGSIYCATKAAVRSFTDSLRRELIASRVRVLEVDPGQVETVSTILRARLEVGFASWGYKSILMLGQEFSVVRFYGDKAKADAVYALVLILCSISKSISLITFLAVVIL
jgi:3-hydroxy acid dehydrogenase/malonic semialdehyde reductase